MQKIHNMHIFNESVFQNEENSQKYSEYSPFNKIEASVSEY